jgi:hypothetical protein
MHLISFQTVPPPQKLAIELARAKRLIRGFGVESGVAFVEGMFDISLAILPITATTTGITEPRIGDLYNSTLEYLKTSADLNRNDFFIEIEDAIMLLKKANTYDNSDFVASEGGENDVVREWWQYFDQNRARWIA